MKIWTFIITLAILCIFPSEGNCHPGKTDRYGGHKCLRDCEEWKLYYSEYHLHDKDGKPIRVAKKPKKQAAAEPVTAPSVTDVQPHSEPPRTVQTVTVYQYVKVASEKEEPFNPLPWVLLVLLLLLLILRIGRKKKT